MTGGSGPGERARVAGRVRELLGAVTVADPRPGDGFRWDPGRRGAAAVGVAVLVAVAVTLWWLMTSRPQAVPVSTNVGTPASSGRVSLASSGPGGSGPGGSGLSGSAPAGSGPAGSVSPLAGGVIASPSAATVLVVDVAGKVRRPGVYRLPPGSRVDDAVAAAGGARTGVSTVALNLAALLQDGQQIVVGASAASSAGVVPGSSAVSARPTAAAGPVNLNTASLEQLDTLPGVGPVLAQHILDWRAQHGRFTTVGQLNEVSGIGGVKFGELHSLVTV